MDFTELDYINELHKTASRELSEKRLSHVVSVAKTAFEICQLLNLSYEETRKTVTASYLHDITKEKSKEEHFEICKRNGIVLSDDDKRADEVLLSSVGLDSSISAISKDGVISKSGSDSYYNYLIYLLQLTPEDEICSEPFNWAMQINFPELYAQGYRIGFYREVPTRQEDVSPQNRLNTQQS